MQINTLKLSTKRKARKTIGRGGKKGTYSGKGCKGQKARSGAHVNPLFEGGRSTLIDHMKKKRGFTSRKIKKTTVKLSMVEKKFKEGDAVNMEGLVKAGLVAKTDLSGGAKIVGGGKIGKKLTFGENIFFSKSIKK